MEQENKAGIKDSVQVNLSESDKLKYTKQLNKLIDEMLEPANLLMNEDNTFMQDNHLQNKHIETSKSVINVIKQLTGKEYNLNFMDFMFHCSVRNHDYDTIQKVINECFDGIERKDLKSFHYEGDTRIEEMSEYDPFFNYYLNQANKEISKLF